MPRSSSKHQSTRASSHAKVGSSSKRQSRSSRYKSSKGGWEGMSSASSNLDELKKRVTPRMLEGKTAEDFRRPYQNNLQNAETLQDGLNDSKNRLHCLEQHKRYKQEMENLIYPLIDPKFKNHKAQGKR